jgi:transposase InsO family protein
VQETDSADHAAHLMRRTVLAEGTHTARQKPVLHGDNGATLKATTVLAMLHWLGIKPSYSRPRVSDDNAYAEALFRTAKYRPEFPAKGFASLDEVRAGVTDSSTGTTSSTAIVASAMSRRRSAMPARTARC